MDRQAVTADLLLLLTAFIWGAAFVAQRVAMDHIGPMTFNGIRFALGAAVLLPLAARSGGMRAKQLPRKYAFLGAMAAGAALFGGASFQQVGLVYTTAGKAGFITGLYVVIVPLMGLVWRQRAGAGSWIGAVLSAMGLYLLSITSDFTMAWGDFLVLISAVMFAVHVLVIGALAPRMNPVRLACFQFWVCAGLSMAWALAFEEITAAGISAAAVPILYGGALSVGVAYTLQVVAQRHAPAAHAAIILSLEAVFAALTGWLLLTEILGPRELAGCALMLTGMLASQLWPLYTRRRRR